MEKRYPATILATPCIPLDAAGELAEAVFRRQVRMFLDRGVHHLYVFGTAGEGYAVTDRMFEQVVTAFAEEMEGPDRFPMVGLIHLSLPVLLQRIRTAYELGIRDFQFALPSWGALSREETERCFEALCGSYPDCRFMHYNLGRAKRLVAPDEYFALAERLPNFVGAKYTTDSVAMIHALVSAPSPLQFYFGETGYAVGSMFGECGLLISLANTNLRRAWEFVAAGRSRDCPKLVQFVDEMEGVLRGLFDAAGADKMDGAYDKLLFRMVDPQFPLDLLPPYSAASAEQGDRFRAFLQAHYPQWLESEREEERA